MPASMSPIVLPPAASASRCIVAAQNTLWQYHEGLIPGNSGSCPVMSSKSARSSVASVMLPDAASAILAVAAVNAVIRPTRVPYVAVPSPRNSALSSASVNCRAKSAASSPASGMAASENRMFETRVSAANVRGVSVMLSNFMSDGVIAVSSPT